MLKLGIVGWGYWGRNYAKYFDTSLDASLEWVCELRPEMQKDAKKRHPHLNITDSISEMVAAKVDGVIIATPGSTHLKVASELLKHHIALLVEKPLTNSYKSALEFKSAAAEMKDKVVVGHTFLYNQAVNWIKQTIEEGNLGALNYLEFKRQSYGPIRDDVNILWDFAPHDLSIISYVLNNQRPDTIYARAKSYSRNSQEDIGLIILEYPENILVNINVAWMYPIKVRQSVILGNKKMLVFEDTNTTEPIRVYDNTLQYPSESDPASASFRLGDITIPRIKPVDPLYNLLKHFIAVIKGDEKPRTSIIDGIENVMLLEAINESVINKKEIDYKDWINTHAAK